MTPLPLFLALALITGEPVHFGPMDPVRHAALLDDWGLLQTRHEHGVTTVPDGEGGLYHLVGGGNGRLYRIDREGRVLRKRDAPFGLWDTEQFHSAILVPFEGGFGALFWPRERQGSWRLTRYEHGGRALWSRDLGAGRAFFLMHRAGSRTYLVWRPRDSDDRLLRVQVLDGRGRARYGAGRPLPGTETLKREELLGVAEDRGDLIIAADVRIFEHGRDFPTQGTCCRAWRVRPDGTMAWTQPVDFGDGAAPPWDERGRADGVMIRGGAAYVDLAPVSSGEMPEATRQYRIARDGTVEELASARRIPRSPQAPLPTALTPMPDLGSRLIPTRDTTCPLTMEGAAIVHRTYRGVEPEGLEGCDAVDLSVRLPVDPNEPVVLDPGFGGPLVRLVPDAPSPAVQAPPVVVYGGGSHAWNLDPFGLRVFINRRSDVGWTVQPPYRPRASHGGAEILDAEGRVVLTAETSPDPCREDCVGVEGQRIVVRAAGATANDHLRPSRWLEVYWRRGRTPPVGLSGLLALSMGGSRALVLPRASPVAASAEQPRILDVATDRWSAIPDLPRGLRVRSGATLPDGRILVAGLLVGEDARPAAWWADPVTGALTEIPGLPAHAQPERALGAGNGMLLGHRGEIYVHQADGSGWTTLVFETEHGGAIWEALPDGRGLVIACGEPKAAIIDPVGPSITPIRPPQRGCVGRLNRSLAAVIAPARKRPALPGLHDPDLESTASVRAPDQGQGHEVLPLGGGRAMWVYVRSGHRLHVVDVTAFGTIGRPVLLDGRTNYGAAVALPEGTVLIFGGHLTRMAPMLVRRPGRVVWEHLIAQ